MADLRALVRTVHGVPGVRGAIAAGRDGLLIDAAGVDTARAEHVAALAPGLTQAADQLADAAGCGAPRAVAVEGEHGVLVALALSTDVTLVAMLGADAGDEPASVGEAVYALRRARSEYATLV